MALNLIEDNDTNLSLTVGGATISRKYTDDNGQEVTTPIMHTATKPKQTLFHRLLAEPIQGSKEWTVKHSSFRYDHQELQEDPDMKTFEDKKAARAYMTAYKPPFEAVLET